MPLEQNQESKTVTSEPTQGKPSEPPKGAVTATSAPALTLGADWEQMETAQLALDAYWACHSGCACVGLLCEHFHGIHVLWQKLEICRKVVESSLVYTNEHVSAQEETHVNAQCSAVAKLETLVHTGNAQGNLLAVPAAFTPTQAMAQVAVDSPSKAGVGQITKEEVKLPKPCLAEAPGCTQPDAAMSLGGPSAPTAAMILRARAANSKPMPLEVAAADVKVPTLMVGLRLATPVPPGTNAEPAAVKEVAATPGLAVASVPMDSMRTSAAVGRLGDPHAPLQKQAPPNLDPPRAESAAASYAREKWVTWGAASPTPIDTLVSLPMERAYETKIFMHTVASDALLPPEIATPEPTGVAAETAALVVTEPCDPSGVVKEASTHAGTTLRLVPYAANVNTPAPTMPYDSCSPDDAHVTILQD